MTLLVNILAIVFDSGNAFAGVTVTQLVFVTCIRLLNLLKNDRMIFSIVLNLNPIAHLIVGWQYSSVSWLNEAIHAPWNSMPLWGTVFYMIAIAILLFIIGGKYVDKCDLIISDLEYGGI